METKQNMLRLFVGAAVSRELEQAALAVREESGKETAFRWLPAEHLHCTVAFMKAVPEEMLGNLVAMFTEGYRRQAPFTLEGGHWAWMPERFDVRMLWLRFGPSLPFVELAVKSQDWLEQVMALPQQRERPRAHVTICRISRETEPWPLETIAPATMAVEELRLWQSIQPPGGGYEYRELARFRLG